MLNVLPFPFPAWRFFVPRTSNLVLTFAPLNYSIMLRLRNLLLCSSAFAALSAGAQEKQIELDPVTVSSSLSPVAASKTGRNILVIRGEEISRLPVHSLDELLRYVPGMEVQA